MKLKMRRVSGSSIAGGVQMTSSRRKNRSTWGASRSGAPRAPPHGARPTTRPSSRTRPPQPKQNHPDEELKQQSGNATCAAARFPHALLAFSSVASDVATFGTSDLQEEVPSTETGGDDEQLDPYTDDDDFLVGPASRLNSSDDLGSPLQEEKDDGHAVTLRSDSGALPEPHRATTSLGPERRHCRSGAPR